MKIVCDACQAKYSISDDKVQGKVFKIRCKKCSNIIVVRGGANAAEPAAAPAAEKETRVYDYGYEGGDQAPAGDDAVWHVVLNQDQVGPMTAAEVQQKFAAGEIDGETYIWREGFTDWLPMSQVDTFAAFVASGNTTAAVSSSSGSGASAVAAMFGGGAEETGTVRSDPGDLFAAASGGARGGADDEGDLFGSKPGTGGGQAAASSAGGGSSKLRGERNENSVLFSLGNLAQLASDRPAPAPAATSASSSSSGHASGAAGGEGSGLIDIRSMATAYRGGTGTAAKPSTASAGIGSIDDLPVFSGGGFAEPAVIMPTSRPARDNKMMYALIGAVGILAVAAIILVVVLMKGDGDKKTTANTVAAADTETKKDDDDKSDEAKKDETKPDEAKVATPSSDTKDSADVAKTDTTTTPEPTEKADPPKDSRSGSTARDTRSRDKAPPREPAKSTSTATAAPKETVKPPSDGGCDEVSCVLSNYEGACCAKFKKGGSKTSGAAKPSGGGDLPDSLDRSMISEGVGKVKARVIACGDKSSAKGDVKVKVKVNPDGSVGNVSVTSSPDGALGSCVASAMQKASFKKTQSGGTFSYPFKF